MFETKRFFFAENLSVALMFYLFLRKYSAYRFCLIAAAFIAKGEKKQLILINRMKLMPHEWA